MREAGPCLRSVIVARWRSRDMLRVKDNFGLREVERNTEVLVKQSSQMRRVADGCNIDHGSLSFALHAFSSQLTLY